MFGCKSHTDLRMSIKSNLDKLSRRGDVKSCNLLSHLQRRLRTCQRKATLVTHYYKQTICLASVAALLPSSLSNRLSEWVSESQMMFHSERNNLEEHNFQEHYDKLCENHWTKRTTHDRQVRQDRLTVTWQLFNFLVVSTHVVGVVFEIESIKYGVSDCGCLEWLRARVLINIAH